MMLFKSKNYNREMLDAFEQLLQPYPWAVERLSVAVSNSKQI